MPHLLEGRGIQWARHEISLGVLFWVADKCQFSVVLFEPLLPKMVFKNCSLSFAISIASLKTWTHRFFFFLSSVINLEINFVIILCIYSCFVRVPRRELIEILHRPVTPRIIKWRRVPNHIFSEVSLVRYPKSPRIFWFVFLLKNFVILNLGGFISTIWPIRS